MTGENLVSIESPDFRQITQFRDLVKDICANEDYVELGFDDDDLPHVVVGRNEENDDSEYYIDRIEYFTDIRGARHDFVVTYFSTSEELLDRRYHEINHPSQQSRHPSTQSITETSDIEAELARELFMISDIDKAVLDSIMQVGQDWVPIYQRRDQYAQTLADRRKLSNIRKFYADRMAGNRLNQADVNSLMKRVIEAFDDINGLS
jgi:hypothetical protein